MTFEYLYKDELMLSGTVTRVDVSRSDEFGKIKNFTYDIETIEIHALLCFKEVEISKVLKEQHKDLYEEIEAFVIRKKESES